MGDQRTWQFRMVVVDNILLYLALGIIIAAELIAIDGWNQDVSKNVAAEGQNSFFLQAESVAQLASVRFKDMAAGVLLTKQFAEGLLQGNFTASGTTPLQHFNGAPIPSGTVNTSESTWYNKENSNLAAQGSAASSALYRNPWRAVRRKFITQGFGDNFNFFRYYPLGEFSEFPTMTYQCVSTNSNTNGTIVVGFRPTCRPWYAAASADPYSIHYSVPYLDAFTQTTVITVSTAIVNPTTNTFVGAIFADVQMTDLVEFFNSTAGEDSFVFLLSSDGRMITEQFHVPRGTHLGEALYPTSDLAAERADFEATTLSRILTLEKATVEITWAGAVYIGGFSKVPGTDYITVALAKKETVLKAVTQMKNDADDKIFVIAYLLSYFALFTFGYGAMSADATMKTPCQGVGKMGLPIAFLFFTLLCISLPLSLFANFQVVDDAERILDDNTNNQITNLANNTRSWLETYLTSIDDRVISPLSEISSAVGSSLLGQDIAVRTSYYDDSTSSLAAPLIRDSRLPNRTDGFVSLSENAYGIPGVSASAVSSQNVTWLQIVNRSSTFNQFFQTTYRTHEDVVASYLAYETGQDPLAAGGVFRKYPGAQVARSYRPRSRSWYSSAKAASPTAIYTQAYRDAFSGALMITVASHDNNPNAGFYENVVGADVLISTITDVVTAISFFKTGKVTLLDIDGSLALADNQFPNPTTLNPYTRLTRPGIDPGLWAELQSKAVIAPRKYFNGGVEYYITSQPLTGSGFSRYSVLVSAPVSEARAGVDPILARIRSASAGLTAALIIFCLIVIAIIIAAAGWVGSLYEKPAVKEGDGKV